MYQVFNKEISYIKNERIKRSLIIFLDKLPSYFYEIPASSTGKYHPDFALGKSGLVRHTKVAVRIAVELFNNPSLTNFKNDEKDLLIFSLIIHDGLKDGFIKGEYTVFEHPILISNFIKECKNDLELKDKEIDFISDVVITHMGPWTKNYKGEEVLTPPKSKYQKFVHMCDYLASRKFLDVKFDNNDNIIY